LARGPLGSDSSRLPEAVQAEMTESPVSISGNGAGLGEAVIDLRQDGDVGLHLISPDDAIPVGVGHPTGLLAARWWQLAVKRAMDVVGSILLLIVLFPVWVAVAVAIRLTSKGPALYVQERVGRDGVRFLMLKFRSMRVGADESRDEFLHLNRATGPTFKISYDPRTTKVGRVIRRLSIDELPQLVNVLVGDMSLVGPRPPLPDEYDTYDERQRDRLAVTPGLTCIWQVSGRSDLHFDTWVAMDLEYIETWNVRKDLEILLRTIPAVVTGRGAY
jgi:lipopolysaccharide/colanic/teichoic acid biosynthesis glycosyltransferase